MSNRCFGCGTENEHGLHLTFWDEPDHSATGKAVIIERYAGEPGVVHGGIQATLFDEVLCKAVQYDLRRFNLEPTVVTGSMNIQYRSPCPTERELTLRASVDKVEWPWYFVSGEILIDSGAAVSNAAARWRVMGDIPAPIGVSER